jgi:hypothetical protein
MGIREPVFDYPRHECSRVLVKKSREPHHFIIDSAHRPHATLARFRARALRLQSDHGF